MVVLRSAAATSHLRSGFDLPALLTQPSACISGRCAIDVVRELVMEFTRILQLVFLPVVVAVLL